VLSPSRAVSQSAADLEVRIGQAISLDQQVVTQLARIPARHPAGACRGGLNRRGVPESALRPQNRLIGKIEPAVEIREIVFPPFEREQGRGGGSNQRVVGHVVVSSDGRSAWPAWTAAGQGASRRCRGLAQGGQMLEPVQPPL
jgi:hypothetical protein